MDRPPGKTYDEVVQGSVLGPLLFNIDLWDLFLIMNHEDIGNYAHDNIHKVVRFLEESPCYLQIV